jgi:hypothetical protein
MTMIKFIAATALAICSILPLPAKKDFSAQRNISADICIYGATSGGVIAAYTALKQGKSVVLVEPSSRIGGMTTGGLGFTDVGHRDIIRGYALDFYRRVGKAYGKNEPVFKFEPKVALAVYNDYASETDMHILRNYRIAGCTKSGATVTGITLENSLAPQQSPGKTVTAKVFIDCSYEGDLMARAGISYTVGREGNDKYGETYNGVQIAINHQLPPHIDPYREKGNPASGLLWGILPGEMGQQGSGDNHIQAYNYRIALTDNPENRIEIAKPENYDPAMYELMLRMHEGYEWQSLNDVFAWDRMPNNKTDINNRNGFSTDMIGANWEYPEASYAKRDSIAKAHRDYTLGMLWFVGHDSRIPEKIRNEMLAWGLPKDEYEDTGHFTPQLYIRESRRMLGCLVMTQYHCQGIVTAPDAVGWAAYTMDSHNSGRFVVNGQVKNEGNVEMPVPGPYAVGYGAIVPRAYEADNVIVPVCLSASHIAYGSIRMEPVFMVLGESAALAACQAIDRKARVQDVDVKSVMQKFGEIETGLAE